MNLIKEFLKPNWWKIGIFVILLILAFMTTQQKESRIYSGYPINYESVYTTKINPIFFPLGNFLYKNLGFGDSPFGAAINVSPLIYLLLLGFVAYWYLLSCLIYLIFKKIKERYQT